MSDRGIIKVILVVNWLEHLLVDLLHEEPEIERHTRR